MVLAFFVAIKGCWVAFSPYSAVNACCKAGSSPRWTGFLPFLRYMCFGTLFTIAQRLPQITTSDGDQLRPSFLALEASRGQGRAFRSGGAAPPHQPRKRARFAGRLSRLDWTAQPNRLDGSAD
jgi:hypothetical protein